MLLNFNQGTLKVLFICTCSLLQTLCFGQTNSTNIAIPFLQVGLEKQTTALVAAYTFNTPTPNPRTFGLLQLEDTTKQARPGKIKFSSKTISGTNRIKNNRGQTIGYERYQHTYHFFTVNDSRPKRITIFNLSRHLKIFPESKEHLRSARKSNAFRSMFYLGAATFGVLSWIKSPMVDLSESTYDDPEYLPHTLIGLVAFSIGSNICRNKRETSIEKGIAEYNRLRLTVGGE